MYSALLKAKTRFQLAAKSFRLVSSYSHAAVSPTQAQLGTERVDNSLAILLRLYAGPFRCRRKIEIKRLPKDYGVRVAAGVSYLRMHHFGFHEVGCRIRPIAY